MSSQRDEIAKQVIDVVMTSLVAMGAALVLTLGADAHARAGDRFRCIPADGGASYTSPGTCRSNTDARESLTEQEKADSLATESRGRAFVRCTAADGSYSKFVFKEECPSATDIRTIEYAQKPIQRTREGAPQSEAATPSFSPPASIASTPFTSVSVASPSGAATLPLGTSPVGARTGSFVPLALFALMGLGIYGISRRLVRRSEKAKFVSTAKGLPSRGTPSVQEIRDAEAAQLTKVHTAEAASGGPSILFFVLGTLVWAFIWAGIIAPLLGLNGMSVKFHLLFVFGIPVTVLWLRDKVKASRQKNGD